MNPIAGGIIAGLAWLLSAALMVAWPNGGLQPGGWADPMLIVTLVLCTYLRPSGAAWVAVLTSVTQGALFGADMSAIGLSRIAVAVAASFLGGREIPVGVPTRVMLVAAGSLVANLILMLLAPPPEIGPFIRVTILSALINGALAVPLALVLHRCFTRRTFH